jgi:hypothetical protein
MSESDTSSVTSSTTSFGDISVCEEIGQLIEQCQSLHEHIHNSFKTLKNIHSLVENHNNINITYNSVTIDLNTILEQIHKEALEDIQKTCRNTFGERLLNMLENATF